MELQKVLTCIDYYYYDLGIEAIHIVGGAKHKEAVTLYDELINKHIRNDDEVNKWHFDIALDFIRRCDEYDLETLFSTTSYTELFLTYREDIIERYLDDVKKHEVDNADNVVFLVMKAILALIHDKYDYRNEELTQYFDDLEYETLYYEHYPKHQALFDDILNKLINHQSNFEDSIQRLKDELNVKDVLKEIIGDNDGI